MNCQMIRVISSPSSSTTFPVTLIFDILACLSFSDAGSLGVPAHSLVTRTSRVGGGPERSTTVLLLVHDHVLDDWRRYRPCSAGRAGRSGNRSPWKAVLSPRNYITGGRNGTGSEGGTG